MGKNTPRSLTVKGWREEKSKQNLLFNYDYLMTGIKQLTISSTGVEASINLMLDKLNDSFDKESELSTRFFWFVPPGPFDDSASITIAAYPGRNDDSQQLIFQLLLTRPLKDHKTRILGHGNKADFSKKPHVLTTR